MKKFPLFILNKISGTDDPAHQLFLGWNRANHCTNTIKVHHNNLLY